MLILLIYLMYIINYVENHPTRLKVYQSNSNTKNQTERVHCSLTCRHQVFGTSTSCCRSHSALCPSTDRRQVSCRRRRHRRRRAGDAVSLRVAILRVGLRTRPGCALPEAGVWRRGALWRTRPGNESSRTLSTSKRVITDNLRHTYKL